MTDAPTPTPDTEALVERRSIDDLMKVADEAFRLAALRQPVGAEPDALAQRFGYDAWLSENELDRLAAIRACPAILVDQARAVHALQAALSEAEASKKAAVAREADLRAALVECRSQFLGYVDHHDAKRTIEGTEKANTNQRFVTMCDRVLANAGRPSAAIRSPRTTEQGG